MGHAGDEALSDRVVDHHEHDRDRDGRLLGGHQLRRIFAHALDIATGPAPLDRDATPLAPAELHERLPECRDARLYDRVTFACGHESADPPHWTELLRACRERPCCRSAD